MELNLNAILELLEIVILVILSILVLTLTKDINQLKRKTENMKYTKHEESSSAKITTCAMTSEKQLNDAEIKAERDRIQAQAEADVQKIEADAKAYMITVQAEAEAKANKEIAESLNDQMIKYQMISKWDGKLPSVASGSNVIGFPSLTE